MERGSDGQEKGMKGSSVSSRQRNPYQTGPSLSKTFSERRSMAHWVEEEKEEFKKQLSIHGKNWKLLAQMITNKTEKQIRNFYQNYKKKMHLEDLLPKGDKSKGKKSESSLSGIKRTRSFNKSMSPFKKRNKKRKVISSNDESGSDSLSEIEEEKEQKANKKNISSSLDSSSSQNSNRKRTKKQNQKNKKSSSSSSDNESGSKNSYSKDSSLDSDSSISDSQNDRRMKDNEPDSKNFDSGDDLD